MLSSTSGFWDVPRDFLNKGVVVSCLRMVLCKPLNKVLVLYLHFYDIVVFVLFDLCLVSN